MKTIQPRCLYDPAGACPELEIDVL